jgi:NTP pyrophosphatase (non-canonical NTP hydrolase)
MSMNIDDFQTQALKSIAITERGPVALAHRTLGLNGEAGILANQLKKVIRDKNSMPESEDTEAVKKRLGDVLYYTAALADYFGLTLSEIAQQNLEQSEAFMRSRQGSSNE